MFPIDMQHIGKIDAVGTVQVSGYSAREVDCDLAHLNYVGPPTALVAARQRRRAARKLPEHTLWRRYRSISRLLLNMGHTR